MRMWCTDPTKMCKAHILGEHRELHMFVGMLAAPDKITVWGHLRAGQADVRRIVTRHEELVKEFRRRGWLSGIHHETPLTAADVPEYKPSEMTDYRGMGWVDIEANEADLRRRCKNCRY